MPTPREYFYTLDLNGELIHDGTVLRDRRFLDQFFARLRANDTGRHPEHRFVSVCAGELNYLRPRDPRASVVFVKLIDDAGRGRLLCYAGSLHVPFDPTALRCSPDGRLYHPAPVGFGLLASPVAIDLAPAIEEENGCYTIRHGTRRSPLRPL